jgi:N-acetylmuramoyl-L-alanine amidase
MATVLKRGSRGKAVRELQTNLNLAGVASPPLVADGSFGAQTDKALRGFQKRFGLVVDGLAGAQTQTALKRAIAPAAKPTRAEPDKTAIGGSVPVGEPRPVNAGVPPNVASLALLDTARPIHEIIVHCAATPDGKDFTVDDIRAWHKARGFSDVGYHYVVYRDGRVMLGRPVGQVGAHVEGHNTGTIGISYVGGVSADGKVAKDTRTEAQCASLLWLVAQLTTKHRGIRKITGHNQYAAKACPSFDVRQDALGKLI